MRTFGTNSHRGFVAREVRAAKAFAARSPTEVEHFQFRHFGTWEAEQPRCYVCGHLGHEAARKEAPVCYVCGKADMPSKSHHKPRAKILAELREEFDVWLQYHERGII